MAHKSITLLAGLLVLSLTCLPTLADTVNTISLTDGTNGASNHVRDGSYANDNYANTNIDVYNGNSPSWRWKGAMRFDVSSISDPLSSAYDVKLDIYKLYDTTGTLEFWAMPESGENWDASTLTWNNMPHNQLGGMSFLSPAYSIGTVDVSGPGAATFSSTGLTDLVKNDTNGVISIFATTATSSQSLVFYGTGENGAKLSFTTVPEPATMGLLGIGGLALLRRRSRKA